MHVNPLDFVRGTALMRTFRIVLEQTNTFLFPKSVITYTRAPQINMEIPPKLTREVKQLRDYVSQNGLKNIEKPM